MCLGNLNSVCLSNLNSVCLSILYVHVVIDMVCVRVYVRACVCGRVQVGECGWVFVGVGVCEGEMRMEQCCLAFFTCTTPLYSCK